jgi:multidrug resistance efflux pump
MDDSNRGKLSRSRGFWRVIATLVITAGGIIAGIQLWQRYMLTPWTRDGRVLANSVTIASEVSGRIVDIRVRENQLVKKGDILFIIDQSTYKAALDIAEASVASNRSRMDLQKSNAARAHKLTSLSISAQQLEDLDLQAKSAERTINKHWPCVRTRRSTWIAPPCMHS